MKGKLLTLLVVAVVSTSLGMSSAWAQVALAKSLVGKWEVTWAGSAGAAVGDANRTLIIESVTQKDGAWVGAGRYGITGKGLGKVEIEVGDSAGRPFLRFVTGGPSTVRLTLTGAKELTGTTTISGLTAGTGRGGDRALALTAGTAA
jgi:hypothetical protein